MTAIPPFRLAAYAAPAIPLAALYFPVFVFLAPFYATERGIDVAALGAALIAVRLMDAVTDPAMGWLSDRLETRWGRRRPWLALATPLVILSVWMAMRPPEDAGLGYATFWFAALAISWTVALTPYYAWGAEMTADYAERGKVTAWRECAALLGTVGAAVLYNAGGGGGAGLGAIAIFVALALPLAALAALRLAPEGPPQLRRRLKFGEGLAAMRANGPFLRLLTAYFVNGSANAFPAALFLFFASDYLGADDQAAGLFLVIYFLCAIAGAPFWLWLARRTSKHRAWCAAMIYASAIFALVPLLGEGDLAAFGAICVLTGLAFGADLALPPAIQADVVDVDSAATGADRAGLFFAIWSVATKSSVALFGGLAFVVLGLAGFAAGEANTPEALTTLALLYAAAPAALKLAAVALMWRFPLDAAAHRALRETIDARASS